MKLPVGITPNTTSVTCHRGNQAECAFDVKNTSDTILRVGFDTVGLPAERGWTSIAEDVEIKLPSQALEKIKVLVQVPADADAGNYELRLRAYDPLATERAEVSAAVALTVLEPLPKSLPVEPPPENGRTKRNWKLIATLAGCAVLLIGVVGAFLWLRGEPIPSVIGLNVPTAEKRLIEAGFKLGELTLRATGESPGGTVTAQSPEADDNASPETPVDLVVEKQRVTVPRLQGLALPDAVAMLTRVGLSHGATTTQITGVARLTVLDHKPAGGNTVEAGATVDLIVEGESVRVPSVLDTSLQQATTALVGAGLKVAGIKSVDPEGGATVCTIKSQEPAPGAFVPPGSDAHLVVRRNQIRLIDKVRLKGGLSIKIRERVTNVDCR